jgi:hypothetical protein
MVERKLVVGEACGSLCLGFGQCVLRFSKPTAASSYPSFTRPSPRASRCGSRILPRESWARAAWAQDLKCNLTLEGIDVMQAELVAQTTWRCQEKTEMVGSWKAKIYDMHDVQVGGAQYAKIWSNGCDCWE